MLNLVNKCLKYSPTFKSNIQMMPLFQGFFPFKLQGGYKTSCFKHKSRFLVLFTMTLYD